MNSFGIVAFGATAGGLAGGSRLELFGGKDRLTAGICGTICVGRGGIASMEARSTRDIRLELFGGRPAKSFAAGGMAACRLETCARGSLSSLVTSREPGRFAMTGDTWNFSAAGLAAFAGIDLCFDIKTFGCAPGLRGSDSAARDPELPPSIIAAINDNTHPEIHCFSMYGLIAILPFTRKVFTLTSVPGFARRLRSARHKLVPAQRPL